MSRSPPEPLTFFLDANLDGGDLVERLRAGGLLCVRLRDEFAQDSDDEAWIPAVTARGWVVVTRDDAIRRRAGERMAWRRSGATLVVLRGKGLTAPVMAAALLAAERRGLSRMIRSRVPPMILHVAPDGRVTVSEGGDRRGAQRRP